MNLLELTTVLEDDARARTRPAVNVSTQLVRETESLLREVDCLLWELTEDPELMSAVRQEIERLRGRTGS